MKTSGPISFLNWLFLHCESRLFQASIMNPIQTGLRIKEVYQLTSLEKSRRGETLGIVGYKNTTFSIFQPCFPQSCFLLRDNSCNWLAKDWPKELLSYQPTTFTEIILSTLHCSSKSGSKFSLVLLCDRVAQENMLINQDGVMYTQLDLGFIMLLLSHMIWREKRVHFQRKTELIKKKQISTTGPTLSFLYVWSLAPDIYLISL